MTHAQSKYWYGVLLESVADLLEIPKYNRKKANKLIHLSLKTVFEIDSMKNVQTRDFEKVAATTRMLFAREWGHIIPEPDEEDIDITSISMRDFLIHKKIQ